MEILVPTSALAFQQAKESLAVYELASGQLLNLHKSIMVPIEIPKHLPLWLIDTGCQISKAGEIQKCVGAPWEVSLTEAQLHTFC
jgi:hypothetical protein